MILSNESLLWSQFEAGDQESLAVLYRNPVVRSSISEGKLGQLETREDLVWSLLLKGTGKCFERRRCLPLMIDGEYEK